MDMRHQRKLRRFEWELHDMTQTTVIKLGGSALNRLDDMLDFVESLSTTQLVLVHGGGPQISQILELSGHEAMFHRGLRITDKPTLEVVKMALTGQVNTDLVAALNQRELLSVGLSGLDAGTLKSDFLDDGVLGFVGGTPEVDTAYLQVLMRNALIPVLAPLCLGPEGQILNVNADTAAAAVALALKAEHLIFLTDVPGVLDAKGQTLSSLDSEEIDELKISGVISTGMIPKLESALYAVAGGVPKVEIRSPRSQAATILRKESGGSHVSALC